MQFFSITPLGLGCILKSQIKPINDMSVVSLGLEIQEGELEKSMSETVCSQRAYFG